MANYPISMRQITSSILKFPNYLKIEMDRKTKINTEKFEKAEIPINPSVILFIYLLNFIYFLYLNNVLFILINLY